MNLYPYIIVSKNINEIFDGTYYKNLNQKIAPPNKPKAIEYEKNIIVSTANVIGIITIPMLLIGSIPSLINDEGDMKDLALPLFIVNSIFIMAWINAYKKNREIDAQNAVTRKQYYEQTDLINKINNENSILLSKLSIMNDHEKIKNCLVDFYFRNTKTPQKIDLEYKEGKSEKILYETLKEFFNDKIVRKHSIPFDDLNKRPYMPDIIYFNSVTGICIDIEIDEKVAKDSGKLIHTINDNIERDEFFRQKHWHVIRFAEEQILTDLDNCISLINSFLNKYDPEYWEKPLQENGIKFDDLKIFQTIERW